MMTVDLNGLISECPNDSSGSNWVNISVQMMTVDINGLISECSHYDSGSKWVITRVSK